MHKKIAVWNGVFIIALLLSACSSPSNQRDAADERKDLGSMLEQLDEINNRIAVNPDDPDLYHERALFYVNNKEFTTAFKDISDAIFMDSTRAEYYLTLSDISLELGMIQRTIEALEKALVLDNNNTQALIKLAEINIILLDYRKALLYIDRTLKIDDILPQAYFLRGVVFLENGDTLRAIRNFQQSVVVDQDYFDAHVQLGLLFAEKRNMLAVDYFNNALNIDPLNVEVLYHLAMFYQETGDYDRAINTYNLILEADPEFYFANYNLGYIHLVYLEDFPSAIDFFSKAIDVRNDYAEAYYNRGFAYELMLDVEKSREDYRKSLEYYPNYQRAIDGLNRIDEYLYRQN